MFMENKNNRIKLDPAVIPLVNYFNSIGLKTHMSCEGHNQPNKSMFWIEFEKTVTDEDIEAFLIQLQAKYNSSATCGCFAMRIFPGPKYTMRRWRYMAATHEAAQCDYNFFTTGNFGGKGVHNE
jgi:hypothetical protein